MTCKPTIRDPLAGQSTLAASVLLAFAGLLPFSLPAQQQRPNAGAQRSISPAANTAQPRPMSAYGNQPRANQNRVVPNPRQHLGQWMDSHRSLPLDQQQRALEQEPGFHQLRPEVQQHMRDRLTQLNNMTPQRRQQAIDRTEAMERLSPDQRQQVRSAAGQLGSLPEDRRRAVAHAFHQLQAMPDAQRQNYLNSPEYRGQFNDQERSTVNNLLNVSPYLPMAQQQRPAQPPSQYPTPQQF